MQAQPKSGTTTAQPERFDFLILGSGAGGMNLAWDMAQRAHRVAVIERRWIGGSCPNTNCLPSKNVIQSAKIAERFLHAIKTGFLAGSASINMEKVRQRKREMVERLVAMAEGRYKATGAELIMGSGKFVAPKTIEVSLNGGGTRLLKGDKVFLNLGTRATLPEIPGLAAAKPLTHVEILELDRLPENLIVLGGGFVGLEFAQAFRRFGSRVTVVEPGPQLLSREDLDVAEAIQSNFSDAGIVTVLQAETLRVQGRSGDSVSLVVRTPQGEQTIAGSDILVATGRSPNTAGIGLEVAGVEVDGRGYIKVNDRLETRAPDTWAMGECAGSPQFTHVSFDDFRTIRANLDGGCRSTRDRLVPYCLFTDPPLAHVGLSESEAKRKGIAVRVAKIPMAYVVRTHAIGEMEGFMKALIAAENDHILGFTMFGHEAGEVMAAVQTAMVGGMPYTALRDTIYTHPTMAEGLGTLFSQIHGR